MTENETTDLPAPTDSPTVAELDLSGSVLEMWLDPVKRDVAWKSALRFSESDFIPEQYRGKPGNVMVAFEMADMLQVRPIIIMQNLNMIKGQPSFRSTFITVLANQNGRFAHPIEYEVEGAGPTLKVTAWSTIASTGKRVEAWASMEMARKEKWTSNPKYDSMPEHMLHFRSATFLVRRYNPDALFGFTFHDEHEDVYAARTAPRTTAAPSPGVADLNAKISDATAETVDAEITPKPPTPPEKPLDAPPETPAADAPERPF